jgi:hypothetical protein
MAVRVWAAIMVAMSCSLAPAEAQQTMQVELRPSLTGLADVFVQVVVDARSLGQSRQVDSGTIRTDVELRLRRTGIRIPTRDEGQLVAGRPWLRVYVHELLITSSAIAYSVDVGLWQDVNLGRNGTPAVAETWRAAQTLGFFIPGREQTLRDAVGDGVDQFLNAYLAANPRR